MSHRAIQDDAEFARLYTSGMTISALAEKYGCSDRAVHNAIIRLRLPGRIVPRSKQVEDEVVSTYLGGLSQEATGCKLGLSQSQVGSILVKRGIRKHRNAAAYDRHGNWKGGKILVHGYVKVKLEMDSPFFSMTDSSGYVMEHRLVMAQALGRPLTRAEQVHHVDDPKSDNRLENLQLRQGVHGTGIAMECLDCGSRNVKGVPLARKRFRRLGIA